MMDFYMMRRVALIRLIIYNEHAAEVLFNAVNL